MAFGAAQRQGLKRTTAEKELLRNISALEESYFSETDPARKEELHSQLTELKSGLSGISGATYTDLRLENAKLKTKLEEISSQLDSFKGRGGQTVLHIEQGDAAIRMYKIILGRYADMINEREEKTVGDIKSLVTKEDLTIQSLADTFKPEGYNFSNHYFQCAEKAYNYVRDEILYTDPDLNVSFWLTPKEIASEKIGDDEDLAVFLCSLLYALGDESAECIIAELDNSQTHAFVMTTFNGKSLFLDPAQKHGFREYLGDKKELLGKYSFAGSKIKRFAYRFNHENYEQFTQ